jgi:hypothetical protein
MNKIKTLWSKPLFRWFVYQTPLVVFGLFLKAGTFDSIEYYLQNYGTFDEIYLTGKAAPAEAYEINDWNLSNYATLIWILILAPPAVWVWRKPLISWLNKKADEKY